MQTGSYLSAPRDSGPPKLVKGARLVVVKDGPHCIAWTHAEEVNRELVSFLV